LPYSDIVFATQTITRPADTTAYAAGDQVADSTSAPTVLTFTHMSRYPTARGSIKKVSILSSAYVATAPDFELWLFDTTMTPNNDNAAFAPTDAVVATRVAIIPVNIAFVGNATAGAGGNQVLESDPEVEYHYRTAEGTNSLFGCLVVRNAYVPVSGEIFTIQITAERF
jgi:hypothetical protein